MKKKKAFTLAEVLITLGIIGVVAAFTLQSLFTNIRNKQLETQLKHSYSVISQALEMYQAETGEKLTSENLGLRQFKTKVFKYLNVVKDCGYGNIDTDKACLPNLGSNSENNPKTYKLFDGKSYLTGLNYFDDEQVVLSDGSLFFVKYNRDIPKLYVSVDVNGHKKNPNRLGQDLFMFQIDTKGNLLPMGAKGTDFYTINDSYCSPTPTHYMNGAGCTYKALNDKNFFSNLPK